jgi:hypothetical protein
VRAKRAASSARTAAATARQRDAQPFVQDIWQYHSATTATNSSTNSSITSSIGSSSGAYSQVKRVQLIV